MTLQQLRYIVAVNRYRNFARAAESLGITQPTLSGMIIKLEDELDIRIFDRNNKSVTATATGREIVRQAEKAIAEAERIFEIVSEIKGEVSGHLRLSMAPSIAPYLLPQFIRRYTADYSGVALTVEEMKIDNMTDALGHNRIDIGIAVSGHTTPGIYEIPLYSEDFWVYMSPSCRQRHSTFSPESLSDESMWVMKDARCLRDSAFSFCKAADLGNSNNIYEAGNIDTLVRIVDMNGGYTIIPDMHLPLLSPQQSANVVRIDSEYLSRRHVSLYVRDDYVRQRVLDSVIDTLTSFIPASMIEPSILNHGVRLR